MQLIEPTRYAANCNGSSKNNNSRPLSQSEHAPSQCDFHALHTDCKLYDDFCLVYCASLTKVLCLPRSDKFDFVLAIVLNSGTLLVFPAHCFTVHTNLFYGMLRFRRKIPGSREPDRRGKLAGKQLEAATDATHFGGKTPLNATRRIIGTYWRIFNGFPDLLSQLNRRALLLLFCRVTGLCIF